MIGEAYHVAVSLKKLVRQRQLTQLLGLCTVECEDKKILEFNLGGTGEQFPKKDFALVTGLRFASNTAIISVLNI